jgi:hypothetical protein
MARPHPPAHPHGTLDEVFPDTFFVTGTLRMGGAIPVSFSRNMVVLREGGRLVIVNSVRLTDAGLAELEKLGRVTDVIRIAAFHGADDAFYKERFGARVWSVKGQRYVAGFDPSAAPYFRPDVEMESSTELPLAGAKLVVLPAAPPEGLLLVERAGGLLVSGDALQNWAAPDAYFNLPGRLMMRAFGFLRPHNVGPAWLRRTKPEVGPLRALLDAPFDHVLPAHGAAVIGDAREKYRSSIEWAASR